MTFGQKIPSFLGIKSKQDLIDIDNFKKNFHYWDEWTGSRFERVENPNYDKHKHKIENNSICRSNPVTGEWKEL